MIHPDTELRFIGPHVGHGVVATRLIPRGTITWVRDDLDVAFAPVAIERLHPLYAQTLRKYTFVDARGDYVLCWDHARYVNHACQASCLTGGGFDFEVAVRDIQPGEELTDDYGTLNTLDPFPCACGAPGCRGSIGPWDAERLVDSWDATIRATFAAIALVEQPLMPLVAERERVAQAVRDPALVPSCRAHFGPALSRLRETT